jgi:hypothetical protein
VYPFTPRDKWGKLFFIVIFYCFENLRRGKELGRNKRETRRKTCKGSGKIRTIVCWKEEGKVTLMLHKKIKA